MERISQQKQCNPQGVCYIYLYRIIYGQRHTAKLSMKTKYGKYIGLKILMVNYF